MICVTTTLILALSLAGWTSEAHAASQPARKARADRGALTQARSQARPQARPEVSPKVANARVRHAKELLGKHYKYSAVRSTEKVKQPDKWVKVYVDQALKGKWKKYSARVSKAIIEESKRYGFDPLFLVAVIQNESSFRPTIVGDDGEIGLMQLKPSTAEWMAKKAKLPWKGPKTLNDPVANIRIGAAYMAQLRESFDANGPLYIAAYNMGSTAVRRAVEKEIFPKDYPKRVMQHYVDLYRQVQKELLEDTSRKKEMDHANLIAKANGASVRVQSSKQ